MKEILDDILALIKKMDSELIIVSAEEHPEGTYEYKATELQKRILSDFRQISLGWVKIVNDFIGVEKEIKRL